MVCFNSAQTTATLLGNFSVGAFFTMRSFVLALFALKLASCALIGHATVGSRLGASAASRARTPVAGVLPDVQGLWARLSGAPDKGELTNIADEDSAMGEDLEFVPQVLVVGATGRTGLIIVRKLLLRGFRVSVLVRSLSTETLNRLGARFLRRAAPVPARVRACVHSG